MQSVKSVMAQLSRRPGAAAQASNLAIAARCGSPEPRFVQHRAAFLLA
jgi:hypothetical protein